MRALRKNLATLTLAALLGAGGLWGKATTTLTVPENMRALDATQIERTMRHHGLYMANKTSITANGEYSVLRFVSSACDGALDIVPLYRNAEGQALLGSASGATRSAVAFKGQLYPEFPAIRYWLAETGYALRLVSRPRLYTHALALREVGDCGLMALAAVTTRPEKTTAN